jgi:hypothetical protein
VISGTVADPKGGGSRAEQPGTHLRVVTGKYSYANSGGGTGHAVTLVGVFDLPENKGTR